MPGNKKNIKTIYNYLEPYLNSGSPADIEEARKKYWKEYKANWRRNKRKINKELVTSWAPSELTTITKAAQKHNMSRPKFIKMSSLAYIEKQFVVPDADAVNQIRELLALNYNCLDQLIEGKKYAETTGMELLQKILTLEKQILTILENPNELK